MFEEGRPHPADRGAREIVDAVHEFIARHPRSSAPRRRTAGAKAKASGQGSAKAATKASGAHRRADHVRLRRRPGDDLSAKAKGDEGHEVATSQEGAGEDTRSTTAKPAQRPKWPDAAGRSEEGR